MHSPDKEIVYVGKLEAFVSPIVSETFAAARQSTKEQNVKTENAQPALPKQAKKLPVAELVPAALLPVRRFHPTVADINSALKSAKPDSFGEVSANNVHIHPSTRSRLVLILHYLAETLETHGNGFSIEKDRLTCSIVSDTVALEVKEERRRQKHQPTELELQKKEAHDRRRTLAKRRGEWLSWESFWPEYDYIHEGKVAIEVVSWAGGERRKWADGKRQQLESLIDAVAEGIKFHVVYIKEQRLQQIEREKRRLLLVHRRNLQKKRQEREEKRIAFLNDLAEYQKEAARLEGTLSAANELQDKTSEYFRMLNWARDRLADLQLKNTMALMTEAMQKLELFPEVDPLFDPEGDPT